MSGTSVFPKFLRHGTAAISEGGLTLRDWFAGQALIGIASRPGPSYSPDTFEREQARHCYRLADAMLAVGADVPQEAIDGFAAARIAGLSHNAAALAFPAELRNALEKTLETSPPGETPYAFVERMNVAMEALAEGLQLPSEHDKRMAEAEASIARGARTSSHRFKLSEDGNG